MSQATVLVYYILAGPDQCSDSFDKLGKFSAHISSNFMPFFAYMQH